VHIVGSLTSKLSLTNETGRFEDYDYGLSWQCPQVWSHIPNGSKLDQVARSCSQVGPKLEPTGSKLGWSCGLAGQDCSQVGPMLRPCRIESAFGWCWALQHLPVPCTFLAACPGRTWPPQRCGWVLIEYLVQCEADEGVRRRLNQRGQFFFQTWSKDRLDVTWKDLKFPIDALFCDFGKRKIGHTLEEVDRSFGKFTKRKWGRFVSVTLSSALNC
jgi:hypothetical protein